MLRIAGKDENAGKDNDINAVMLVRMFMLVGKVTQDRSRRKNQKT